MCLCAKEFLAWHFDVLFWCFNSFSTCFIINITKLNMFLRVSHILILYLLLAYYVVFYCDLSSSLYSCNKKKNVSLRITVLFSMSAHCCYGSGRGRGRLTLFLSFPRDPMTQLCVLDTEPLPSHTDYCIVI